MRKINESFVTTQYLTSVSPFACNRLQVYHPVKAFWIICCGLLQPFKAWCFIIWVTIPLWVSAWTVAFGITVPTITAVVTIDLCVWLCWLWHGQGKWGLRRPDRQTEPINHVPSLADRRWVPFYLIMSKQERKLICTNHMLLETVRIRSSFSGSSTLQCAPLLECCFWCHHR